MRQWPIERVLCGIVAHRHKGVGGGGWRGRGKVVFFLSEVIGM